MDSAPQVQVGGTEDAVRSTQTLVDAEMTPAPSAGNDGQTEQTQGVSLPDAQPTEEPQPPKLLHFLDFLTSPIVELIVGSDDKKTAMTAHQSLLLESPLLSEQVKAFGEGPRRVELPYEDVEAFGYFLQYQYTRDYAPSQPQTADGADDTGEQLLKHARVYTLAEKLGIPALKSLAHSKIHRINSTSRGELAYARYVYANTAPDDITIRKPVSNFWGMRSHVLRHEAAEDFKQLCLDVPQFCFDVLTVVLDQKEKRAQDRAETESGVKGSGRKRLRSGL
ncbi:hypothetical protein ASPVEDRAFT_605160 [Aspergillus versicolor CBS 583.65]|uniref:BTB domain-containing protein n=1 Tax=Aspergillus versicolor CBS 583.65 TaxID=1036611 RepID=A0A1L9PHK7_ASPVE|nr:uncharacterized protein ASPVEDRAFT_605160 [Aspergillus versicolor CBS 583.65]OJJ01014.1 hypothetical protein ASPVEDRAFT_605160 [Aspergillus versicolor CBS 583.65]